MQNKWKNTPCVLATMHGKERVIAPLLASELGIEVFLPHNFDTDRFGTFTRDIARKGTQLESARNKVLSAMEQTGSPLGIASEGSFGPHPSLPFLQSNLEIVVLVDRISDLEIVGHYRTSDVLAHGHTATSTGEVIEIARSWGFPEQGVILRQSEERNRTIYKDLRSEEQLREASVQLFSKLFVNSVFLETDMRAHRCPARLESIRRATVDLIEKCKSQCPSCSTPGFSTTEIVKGLPCGRCELPTDLAKEKVYSCMRCHFTERRAAGTRTHAEPDECPWCNP